MIQFNKNSFGLAPGTQNVPVPQLPPGASQTAVLPLVQNPTLVSPTAASAVLQVRYILHIPVAYKLQRHSEMPVVTIKHFLSGT